MTVSTVDYRGSTRRSFDAERRGGKCGWLR
jgi:hypothetical protein